LINLTTMKNQPDKIIPLFEKRKSTVKRNLPGNLMDDEIKPVIQERRVSKFSDLKSAAKKVAHLKLNVIALLEKEFGYKSTISTFQDLVVIKVTNEDYERRMGVLIQKIQKIIDQYCPEREVHLFIVIRDHYEPKETIFKVWKSV
jgi:hypothetical protein